MLFNITKYYTKGSLKGQEIVTEMTFRSQEAAESWAEKASLDRLSVFLVIDITRKSKFDGG